MRPVRSRRRPVQPLVDVVQVLAEVAPDVEPPVAYEHGLAELRAVRTQERRLPAVHVAIVPRLAPGVHVREEPRVRLVVAVEVRVRHHGQYRIVCARLACMTRQNIRAGPPPPLLLESTECWCNARGGSAFLLLSIVYDQDIRLFFSQIVKKGYAIQPAIQIGTIQRPFKTPSYYLLRLYSLSLVKCKKLLEHS